MSSYVIKCSTNKKLARILQSLPVHKDPIPDIASLFTGYHHKAKSHGSFHYYFSSEA